MMIPPPARGEGISRGYAARICAWIPFSGENFTT
jgi:hypothetical protein